MNRSIKIYFFKVADPKIFDSSLSDIDLFHIDTFCVGKYVPDYKT